MDITGTEILIDADNINAEENIGIETAYSLLSTFIDKYDYMVDMNGNEDKYSYQVVACANDIYYLIRATWDILYKVKEQNQKVRDLLEDAFNVVAEMQKDGVSYAE